MIRYPQTSLNQDAVVLGAGLDGLLTARVLTEYFHQVTIVTPDHLPTEPLLPQTIGQALPMHLLSVQGYRHLERLFPGLTAELMTQRAPTVEWTADAPALLPGGWAPRFHSDLISRPVTPNLLLHLIRQRLLEFGGGRVTFLEGRDVLRVERHTAVTGVRLIDPQDSSAAVIQADLVVDAAGSRAQAPDWLARSGCALPQQTVGAGGAGLAVRLYRRPANFQPGWQALLVLPQGTQPGGVLVPVEQGCWQVMLVDRHSQPADEAGFMELARWLPTPALVEAVQKALPLTPVFTLADTRANRWHYADHTDWPDGLVVTGGAVLAFNPALGLDLTVSTTAAHLLRDALEEQRKQQPCGDLAGLQRRFLTRLERQCGLLWTALSLDGADHPFARLVSQRHQQVLAAARSDSQIYHDLVSVLGLASPPFTLLNLGMLRQSLRASEQPRAYEALPPSFRPVRVHKTITQEMAALAHLEDP